MDDDATIAAKARAVAGRFNETANGVAIAIIHKGSISRGDNFVKNFSARRDEVVVAVEDDGDGLPLGKDAAGPPRIRVDDAHVTSARVGDLDGNDALVHDVHDAKERAG